MTATMTTTPVHSVLADGIATLTLDDGKVNALTIGMIGAIHEALDAAQRDGVVVVLRGRPGVFSAGFDLATLRSGPFDSATLVRAGFELAERVLSFPHPVIAECTGHAIAMGAFLLCSADHRIGAAGDFRLVANEVAIGLTVPHAAISILRARLTPSALQDAVLLSRTFAPGDAVAAGWLDRVVAPAELEAAARAAAIAATTLDRASHTATKQRLRRSLVEEIRQGIAVDFDDFRRS
jgi:enoyl-CoA hydratase